MGKTWQRRHSELCFNQAIKSGSQQASVTTNSWVNVYHSLPRRYIWPWIKLYSAFMQCLVSWICKMAITCKGHIEYEIILLFIFLLIKLLICFIRWRLKRRCLPQYYCGVKWKLIGCGGALNRQDKRCHWTIGFLSETLGSLSWVESKNKSIQFV